MNQLEEAAQTSRDLITDYRDWIDSIGVDQMVPISRALTAELKAVFIDTWTHPSRPPEYLAKQLVTVVEDSDNQVFVVDAMDYLMLICAMYGEGSEVERLNKIADIFAKVKEQHENR